MNERYAARLQIITPNIAINRLAGWLASSTHPWLSQYLIRYFLARYAVNLSEAMDPNPKNYCSFNDFFTRALRLDARPLANCDWTCPVDGAISQLGNIERDQLFQAKGHTYSTHALLGDDAALAASVQNGHFCTLYLSPKDYHRIHMPHDGHLISMAYVPGQLYSVNPGSARHIPGLFARNERLVCAFDSAHGPFIMVLVGATIVGSIATVWHGAVSPPHCRTPIQWHYPAGTVTLQQGQEMGRFLLGSTVIVLFPPNRILFPTDWIAARLVKLGEAMSH